MKSVTLKRALYGVALVAIAVASNAHAQTTTTPTALPPAAPAVAPAVAAPADVPVFDDSGLKPLYGNVDPFYKTIDPFWKDISPFYGNVDPFWKDINPFYKDIGAFWGNVDPFNRNPNAFVGETPPDYAAVGAFWKSFGPVWATADKQWDSLGDYSANPAAYQAMAKTLNSIVAQSEVQFGQAVTTKTGQSFQTGFAASVFAKYGINLNDPATLAGMTPSKRTRFILDWYDGLMNYAGADHVDHWMGTINWVPLVTRDQGSGRKTIIGILDGGITQDMDIENNIKWSGAYYGKLAGNVEGHGTSVASLIVSAHDGQGVMGIAPDAQVVAYNPFDGNNAASWKSIKAGIVALGQQNASVINMSLGVSGSTLPREWKYIFSDPAVLPYTNKVVFVIAAGNDGFVQNTNVSWNFANDPAMILVGSVGPSGQISTFSNQAGTTCLLNGTTCLEQNRLYNRFIVAPGEAILVSDGMGGLVRRSGTSFAAPLVSGSIALLHNRWPWLANYRRETVDIILRSAKDLGAPGVDPVYGWGLLDVAASQAPLDYNKLVFYEYKNGVNTAKTSAATVKAAGLQANWEADNAFFTVFEPIGGTQRDFSIPLSSRLVGQKTTAGGSEEYFQSYVTKRFQDWLGKKAGFSDVSAVALPTSNGLSLTFTGTSPANFVTNNRFSGAGHSAVTISNPESGLSFTGGYGQGSMALAGRSGFGLTTDYDASEGGVNPVLGFASGGGFAAADVRIAPGLTLSTGVTQQRLLHRNLPGLSQADRDAVRGLAPYQAAAMNIALNYAVSPSVSLGVSYTRLGEKSGLLGVQSVEDGDLRHGSSSDALTLSASAAIKGGFHLSASATAAKTQAQGGDQAFSTASGGILTSAYAVALGKTGIVGKSDQLRLSLTQPLHIEKGVVDFTSVGVTNRLTGDIGLVTQQFNIATKPRTFTSEMLYATPVLGDKGEFSLFGRAELRTGSNKPVDNFILGGRFGVAF